MTKIQDLRQLAQTIKTETKVGGNTADRVGSAFEGVADALEGTEQIAEMDKAVQEVQQKVEASKAQIQSLVNALPVVQQTGDSTTSVMSQKAVTDAIQAEIDRATAAEQANAQAIKEEKAAIIATDRIADKAVTTDKLSKDIQYKIDNIKSEIIDTEDEEIVIEDNEGTEIVRIGDNHTDFFNPSKIYKSGEKALLVSVDMLYEDKIYGKEYFESNKAIRYTTGECVDIEGYFATTFIPISESIRGKEVPSFALGSINSEYGIAFYDSQYNYISGHSRKQYTSYLLYIPINAYYVRVSSTNEGDSVIIKGNGYNRLSNYNLTKNYRYIVTTFGNSEEKLTIAGSNDLEHFEIIYRRAFTPKIGNSVLRDPSPIKIKGEYFIVYTHMIADATYCSIGCCKTVDFYLYEELPNIILKDESGNYLPYESGKKIWAPYIFKDEFNFYIIVNIDLKPYLYKYDPLTNSVGEAVELSTPYNGIIDTHIYKEGNNYYMLTKQESVHYGRISILKASELFGEYNIVIEDLVKDGNKYEGPFAIRLDNGKIRVFFTGLGGTNKSYFVDIDNFETVNEVIVKTMEYDNNAPIGANYLQHADILDMCVFGSGYGIINK